MDSMEERLAVVETKIDALKEDISDLRDSVKRLSKTVSNEMKHMGNRVTNLEIEVHQRRGKQELINNWIKPIILSIIVAVITLLIGG